jgi:hypothetical protein
MGKCFWGLAGGLAVGVLAHAQGYTPPRAADGKADLQGIWQSLNTAAYNVEAHPAALGIPAGLGVIVDPPDGKIPYRPEAAERQKQNFKNRAKADPLNMCFLPGVPRVKFLPFPFQIFQTPQTVAIAYEFAHATRTIYLNGSKHPDNIDFWMADSRGHWEGDTLVVDVANHNSETWLDAAGNHHSDALRVVERYTRTGPDMLLYEATIEDPKVYTRPWKISMPLYRRAEKNMQLLEYECHAYLEEEGKVPR